MPPPPRRYTVHRKDLDRGTEIESKEHPGFGERTHRKIARQHLEKYGPGYYSETAEKVHDRVVENVNHQMRARPTKRRRPEPHGPFYDPAADIERIRF